MADAMDTSLDAATLCTALSQLFSAQLGQAHGQWAVAIDQDEPDEVNVTASSGFHITSLARYSNAWCDADMPQEFYVAESTDPHRDHVNLARYVCTYAFWANDEFASDYLREFWAAKAEPPLRQWQAPFVVTWAMEEVNQEWQDRKMPLSFSMDTDELYRGGKPTGRMLIDDGVEVRMEYAIPPANPGLVATSPALHRAHVDAFAAKWRSRLEHLGFTVRLADAPTPADPEEQQRIAVVSKQVQSSSELLAACQVLNGLPDAWPAV
jgi:hypothetical protein